ATRIAPSVGTGYRARLQTKPKRIFPSASIGRPSTIPPPLVSVEQRMAYGVAISQVDPCAIRGVTVVLGTNAIRGSPRRLWDHGGAGRPRRWSLSTTGGGRRSSGSR